MLQNQRKKMCTHLFLLQREKKVAIVVPLANVDMCIMENIQKGTDLLAIAYYEVEDVILKDEM